MTRSTHTGHGTDRMVRPAPRCEPDPDHTSAARPYGRGRRGVRATRPSPHDGRSPRGRTGSAHRPDDLAPSATDLALVRFTERAVRVVFEVLDGRRPHAHLAPLLAPTPAERVRASARSAAPATIPRIRVRPAGTSAEWFGTYSRGGRVHAVAGRTEPRRTGRTCPHGATITALWLG